MKKLIFSVLAFSTAFSSAAGAQNLTKEDVEKIVQDYIVNNGGVIAESVDGYLAEKRRDAAKSLVLEHTPTFGPEDAKVTFIEFSDFRCGYCRRVQETVVKLREKYGDKVRFAFKNMPILTEDSREAAKAVSAAHMQGKFWEFNAMLWENQARLGADLFKEIATELKLDMKKFEADMASEAVLKQVEQDFMDGQAAGVQGTPHFVVDGQSISGAQPLSVFEEAIERALEDTSEK